MSKVGALLFEACLSRLLLHPPLLHRLLEVSVSISLLLIEELDKLPRKMSARRGEDLAVTLSVSSQKIADSS